MFKAWVESGQNPDSFWDKTPLEVHLVLQAARSAEIRRHNQMVWAVWHVAAFSRAKKLPKLQTLIYKDRVAKPKQSWQEQMHIMGVFAARLNQSGNK